MTKAPKPSRETLAAVLDFVTNDPIYANAMRSVGYRPNTIWLWVKLSRDGAEHFRLAWPDPSGDVRAFHELLLLARQMQCANFEATLRRDCAIGTPRILRQVGGEHAGEPVWETDPLAIAQWPDKETARDLGGIDDWPYMHSQNGARIPVVIYEKEAAAMRQHASKVLLPGWNVSERREVDAKFSGGVMIVKASQQGSTTKQTPPPYSREAMATAQTEQTEAPMSPLKADLLQRLEDLRARGPINPRPDRPVRIEGHGRADDPRERDGVGDVPPGAVKLA